MVITGASKWDRKLKKEVYLEALKKGIKLPVQTLLITHTSLLTQKFSSQ